MGEVDVGNDELQEVQLERVLRGLDRKICVNPRDSISERSCIRR